MTKTISPLFLMHKRFNDEIKKVTHGDKRIDEDANYDRADFYFIRDRVSATIKNIIDTLNFHDASPSYFLGCSLLERILKYTPDEGTLNGFPADSPFLTLYQPYVTIALASLLQAHGASDEAVSVLAEWLWSWEQLDRYLKKPFIPGWYRIDILARLQTILGDVAGNNNRAFRDVLEHYRVVVSDYLATATSHQLRLADIPARCADWSKSDESDTQLGLAYLLWGTEVDSLRTELNFVPEIESFEGLEKLQSRSDAVTKITGECLPKAPDDLFTEDYRAALIAESRVIAGLVTLAVEERMSVLGRSPGDRTRAEDARKKGEEWLINGWADLSRIWKEQSDQRKTKEWPERIFGGTQWDKTASMALRVLSRLHQGE
jgi:hypothetical protein